MKALGMIETRGLVASIVGAYALFMVATFTLLCMVLGGGGVVTIMVRGVGGAVKAATDAGAAAAERVGALISVHVIPRPHEELEEILGHIPADPDQPVPPTPPAPAPEPEPEEGEPLEPEEQESDGAVMEPASLTTEELEHMAVVKLRAVARQIGLTSMTRKEIRFAKKEELLAAITAFLAEQNN